MLCSILGVNLLYANFFCAKLYLIKCSILTINILSIDYLKVLSRELARDSCTILKDPIPLESISEKSERIESYLRHILEVYKNSLNRKYRIMTQKKIS